MNATDKTYFILSLIGGIGVFAICAVLFNNEALGPWWLRGIIALFAVLNLICVYHFDRELLLRSRQKDDKKDGE